MPRNEFGEIYKTPVSPKDTYPYMLLALHSLGGMARNKEVVDKVGKLMAVPDEVLNEETPNPNGPDDLTYFSRRCNAARSVLRGAGFMLLPAVTPGPPGTWQISERGEQQVRIFKKSNDPQKAFDEFRDLVK